MSFETYAQTRPWASAIKEAVALRKMPPWFADPHYGKFANDPSLTEKEIQTLISWTASGAKEGPPVAHAFPPLRDQWNIPKPDVILAMPVSFTLPAAGTVEYQYFVVPTGFSEDKWIQAIELRPGRRDAVHHVVVYLREPGSQWLRDGQKPAATHADILGIYTPGTEPSCWPAGMAKKIPAGSDLVFQIHYTPNGKAGDDLTRIGLVFAKSPPAERILTLQMGNSSFVIPPGDADREVMVRGTLPNDARLISMFPHMHLRGKSFEYRIIPPRGPQQILLSVHNYNFHWQLNYVLAEPLPLKAGTKFEWEARFDNSPNNPNNPDATKAVSYGEQSWEEIMIGFFDVAVPAWMDKERFFERP